MEDPSLEALSLRERLGRRDRRRLRQALLWAALLHIPLFLIHLPGTPLEILAEAEPRQPYQLRDYRIVPPAPPVATREPRPELPRIPVPEVLIAERDPIREIAPIEIAVLEIARDLPTAEDAFPIPEPSPAVEPVEPPPEGPLEVSGEVIAPVRVESPLPRYTEAARRVGLQGTVVLRAVIDEEGRVKDLEVVEGLPLGLTAAAEAAARRWRFEPATLHGRPVPVFWRLTVSFRLR